jgi:hypothetical protein
MPETFLLAILIIDSSLGVPIWQIQSESSEVAPRGPYVIEVCMSPFVAQRPSVGRWKARNDVKEFLRTYSGDGTGVILIRSRDVQRSSDG